MVLEKGRKMAVVSIHVLSYATKLCYDAQMAIFCVIFASCISSEPHAADFRPAF